MLVVVFSLVSNPYPVHAQTTTSREYYVAPNGSATGDGSMEKPLDLTTALHPYRGPVKAGDTVLFLPGIYRVAPGLILRPGGTSESNRTTFKAAPGGGRAIITNLYNMAPKVGLSTYMRVEGLWFGGETNATGETSFQPGGGRNRGIQIVNNTFFGYREGISQGGGIENFLYQGNRFVRSGREKYYHGIYLSGGYTSGKMSNHSIVDNNIIINSGGYGIHGWHKTHNNIVTRNFIANTAHGISMDGSNHLIANNVLWKMKGYPEESTTRKIGAWLLGQNIHFYNNIMGPQAQIYYSHQSNKLENNAYLDEPEKGTASVALTGGQELAALGITEQEIDQTLVSLDRAFAQTVESIYADQTIEAHFARLKSLIPPSSPLFAAGKNWFDAPTAVNIGADAPAPNDETEFWSAFRALGLRDFDSYGKVIGGDTTRPFINIYRPTSGTTVFGKLSLSATAIDNVEVVKVQFKVNGVDFYQSDAPPYAASYDTKKLRNGTHKFTAVATDVMGNSETSTPVTVIVKN